MLGRWSGWGAVPAALDPINAKYAGVRAELAGLLDERELAAARRTVINAHYTDAALVQAIWDGMAMLGFTGGRVLEPGCGSGTFIAFAPQGAEFVGVELDPTTAAIAAALHPHATILAESFARTRVLTGSVDAVVGNVPFGDVRLHDKRDNRGNHAIHNHFIIKSLRAARPGGLVAVVTSAYTMDATNPAARREMQQMADLVGAVRLPSRAHARAAGTDALADVLIFRRREKDREPAPFDWEYTAAIDIDDITLRVNAYFPAQPQRVLGRFATGDGLYRHDEVTVVGDPAAAPDQLRDALARVAEHARSAGLLMTPHDGEPVTARPAAQLPRTVNQPDGYLRANSDATFSRLDDGQWETYSPPTTQAAELRALLVLRDTVVALLQAEAASLDDTDETDRLRARLNTRYDAYLAAHGPINRFTETARRRRDPATGRMVPQIDEETGEAVMRRVRPPQGGFRHDPFAPVVRALETFDEQTQTARKADVFTQRVVAPRPARLGADTPAEALAICLDEHAEARLTTIAWLLGVDEAAARRALGTLAFDDPTTGRLEPAAAYLSGDVKTKLAIARAAADEDDRYTVNVHALTEVIPADLGPEEITDSGAVKMGAPWLGAGYVQQFLHEILDDPTVVVEYAGAMWTVHSERNDTLAARSTWGTDRRPAAEIAQTILEQREFVIKDTVGRKPHQRQVVNLDAIMAATEKAAEMRERFADWIWEDPARAAALVATFNGTFQRYVPRSYADVALTLPGLAMTFQPDPHQIAAVARIIHEPAVGLYHAVGAGKTATMVMGAMELRRLGLARKPVVVVPNQLLDQWTREFVRLYPQAKILAASTEDLTRERRQLMVARMATGDWDAVILTESAFEMLPISPDAEQSYIDRQTADLDEHITQARAAGAELTLKRLETKKANREARLEERLDTDQDAGIWWELTGIDYAFRDESHRDKNLRTVSNVPGMSIKGSQRAQQMDMKLAWLRERHPRWGTRATGTPIANSIVELFTEFRYLRPDLMHQQGITDIDEWLATYAEGKVVIEVTPDGGGLRNKTRLDFVNLDKLITTLHVPADVQTKDDLALPRPPLAARADGQRQPEVVIVQPSPELLDKVAELVARAADLRGRRPEPGADNILKIVGEGAAAALDLRLVGLSTDAPQKIDVAAERIADLYRTNRDRVYLGVDGQPHPTPGALQMVFCDLGTPNDKNPNRFNAYRHLRNRLAARGVPRDQVRFIHDATDDRARAELFAACRDGRVAVLIGSTEKMGTGVNVQDRLLALHHLDCPWRPCDLEQREGRIDRRGNHNDEIHILRYVTERTLDAFKWQKVAYKATLADRILTGTAGARAEDIGDVTLSYEEMKAAATGNPLLVDHAKTKAELARLERLERSYHRNQTQLRWTITHSRQEIDISRAVIAEADAALGRRVDTHGDAFAMDIRGTTYTKRAAANDRLRTVVGLTLADRRNLGRPERPIGTFGGFILVAKVETAVIDRFLQETVRLWLVDAPGTELRLVHKDLTKADLVARLENRLAKLDAVRASAVSDIARREAEIARAEQDLTKPFRHRDDLIETRTRFQHLDTQVVALAAASEANANAAAGADHDTATTEDTAASGDRRLGDVERDGADGATTQPRRTPTSVPAPTRASIGPAPSTSSAATVDDVLAEAALPAEQQRWLDSQLDRLVADPATRAVARANPYDRARMVLDEHLDRIFVDAVDASDIDGEQLAARYFDDPTFHDAFLHAASATVYDRARSAAHNKDVGPEGGPAPAMDDPPASVDAPAVGDQDPGVTGEHATAGPAVTTQHPDDVRPDSSRPTDANTPKTATIGPPRPAGGDASDPTLGPTNSVLLEKQRVRRGHSFYPPADIIATVPRLYATEHQPAADKTLHLHYFTAGSDWWLAEYDPDTGTAFGYACLNSDEGNAEWGYVHLPELEAVRAANGLLIVERDLHWTPVPAGAANLPGWRAPHTADTTRNVTPAAASADPPHAPAPPSTVTEIATADLPPSTPPAADDGVDRLSPEDRLARKVAARLPKDIVRWPDTDDGHPTVLLAMVANGTYGQVTGVDPQRAPITATGYVIEARGVLGGIGGWSADTVMVVKLADLPDGPATATVQADMDGRLTVVAPPESTMPAGESAPWTRMPVEEQILAARTALGLTVQVRDGPVNELWTVQGCPAQLTGEVASWLFGGRYGSWEGQPRPVFRPERIQEAIAAGRIPAEPQPAPTHEVAAPPDGDIEARIARLRPYTELGPQFRRAIAEALTYAQMTMTAGLDPTGALLEGEVSAGLRSRADLAAWRTNGSPPTAAVPADVAQPAPRPAWLAGVLLGEETSTADGRHVVHRRTNQAGTTVYVDARHPQVGMLPRGRIDTAANVPGEGFPRIWRIVDHDGLLLGEHTGSFLDAELHLLAGTAALDELLDDAPVPAVTQTSASQASDRRHFGDNSSAVPSSPHAKDRTLPADAIDQPDAPPAADTAITPPHHAAASGDADTGEPAAMTGPAEPASWTSRVQIVDGASLVVRGTTGAPREERLRGLLKQHRFRYQRASGDWRYAGRPTDRGAAIGDIQRWLAAQDRTHADRIGRPAAPHPPPTEQQRQIIDAYRAGRSIAVQALAGTGKTSTLLMLAAARPQARIAYIAFNRSIADEAQRKFPRNVRADTSHAFARDALAGTPLHPKLGKVGRGARWPEEWVRHLGITAITGTQPVEPDSVARMVMATIRNFRESAADTINRTHLPGHLPEDVPGLARTVLDHAGAAWQDIADPAGALLFDHDDYLKIWALGNPRLPYDVIFFDEAQDINDVLRQVIQDQPAQTIVVGDSNQSIYGFRGAIDALKHWPAEVTLPLTQSWRFGPAVADVGNQFLTLLRSPWLLTGNPALDSSVGLVDSPDAVLTRTNAGAVAAVFDAFDDGKRVALMGGGRAIEDIAKAARDLQAGRGTKHPDLARFADWDEVRAYVEDGDDAQSLRAFVRLVDRRGADGLLQMVKDLVNEDQTDPDGNLAYDVIVSTVHKSKGREWAHVRIAEDFPQPQEDQQTRQLRLPDDEQLRLAYVAVTRAKLRLELGGLGWIDTIGVSVEQADHRHAVAHAAPAAITLGVVAGAGTEVSGIATAPLDRSTVTAAGLARQDSAPQMSGGEVAVVDARPSVLPIPGATSRRNGNDHTTASSSRSHGR